MTREEAIKRLKEARFSIQPYQYINEVLDMAIKALEQKPKTGHWIEEKDDYGEVIWWHCDRCYEDSGFITKCKWDFCPNCGAKMIEAHESEV